MSEQTASKYWLDIVTNKIIEKYPKGKIIVSSGISPSGAYHIGNFREVITTDAIARRLRAYGKKVKHIHFVDDSDPLRRVYPFLPAGYKKWVGFPYWKIPDPQGQCHDTYAEHFFAEFEEKMNEIDVQMHTLISHEQYQKGLLNKQLDLTVKHADKVRRILEEVSGRELSDDWTGVQVLEEGKTFRNIRVEEWPDVKKLVSEGKVKLSWRLDWPARWAALGVDVEPYGREHATKGGSYDTGKRIVKEIFGEEPPYPVPYETINLVGDTKKMSSSIGNLVSLADALDIMPPEVLRYFVIRSRPDRKIYFDSGLGLFNLLDEYSKVKYAYTHKQPTDYKEAYEYASQVNRDTLDAETISTVPFSHLVNVYQTAQGKPHMIHAILKKTGYDVASKSEFSFDVVEREVEYVREWLKKYAPEDIKFEIQKKLPKVKLSAVQKQLLDKLGAKIQDQEELDAQWVHDTIYKLIDELKLKPADAFKAIYRVILGKDSGPRAGWFLASLDKDWLGKRLKLAI